MTSLLCGLALLIKNPSYAYQRWSPRGHILKSLALASKPQVLENCPVLGSRTALFLICRNFVGKRQKPCGKSATTFFLVSSSRDRLKKIFEDLFRQKNFFKDLLFWHRLKKIFEDLFFENTCVCVLGPRPWPRNFFVFLALASSLVFSTPSLTPMTPNSFLGSICKSFLWLGLHCG